MIKSSCILSRSEESIGFIVFSKGLNIGSEGLFSGFGSLKGLGTIDSGGLKNPEAVGFGGLEGPGISGFIGSREPISSSIFSRSNDTLSLIKS